MRRWLLIFPMAGALSISCPCVVQGQSLDDIQTWAEENVPEDVMELLTPPTTEEMNDFWKDVEDTLDSQSLDDFAWMAPYAGMAVEYLRSFPEGESYADWLEQRLDYFDMAQQVEQITSPPTAPVTRKPPQKARLVPPPRPRPVPIPPSVSARRMALVRSPQIWAKKLASRPAPPDAGQLIPRLKSAFQSEGIPPQLVWMAEVESSLNPNARSPVGAAGLFQLMPATARNLGLKTAPSDERLEPEKSARAAAKYLKYLYGKFKSWPLALAAYNAGEGRIGKALAGSGNKTFEGIQDSLTLETQMYVPKIMATISLREGMDPSRLPPPTAMIPSLFQIAARIRDGAAAGFLQSCMFRKCRQIFIRAGLDA